MRLPIHLSHWSRRCLIGNLMRIALLCPLVAIANGAVAQDKTQDKSRPTPRVLPRISHPDDAKAPTKELLARKHQEARSIGFYSAGCLAGGTTLPISGPAWQVMRLSRNRNWGHPTLIGFLENLALEARNA